MALIGRPRAEMVSPLTHSNQVHRACWNRDVGGIATEGGGEEASTMYVIWVARTREGMDGCSARYMVH